MAQGQEQVYSLPSGGSFRIGYWRPHPDLAAYVSGYHRYVISLAPGERLPDLFFPGWANLRFSFPEAPWSLRLGHRTFDPVPVNAVFGATSRAGYSDCGSGVLVGAGLTPAGWARLIARPAAPFADRVVDMADAIGEAADELRRRMDRGGAVVEAFDGWFLERLAGTPPEDPRIARLTALLGEVGAASVAGLAARIGLSEAGLAALSKAHFGFTPKLLTRRARFLRALMQIQLVEQGRWWETVASAGYYDQSHFVRDCRLFLDTTLRSFMARPKAMATASIELRQKVLGAPIQSLHRAPGGNAEGSEAPRRSA